MSSPGNEASGFHELIRRVRAGDERAAAELVRSYEPAIRRVVRIRLSDPHLGRLFDSMDICQSVMKSFFFRAGLGQYELDTPDQLLRLLATMARNKLANEANHQRAARRDVRRVSGELEAQDLAGRGATPSREVAGRELLQVARSRLAPDELELLDRRSAGDDWQDIALQLGGKPDALRKRLSRALDRVAHELGLDEAGDSL
jgi:RNA polymerase sigma-70 factor (ECF subfamily)